MKFFTYVIIAFSAVIGLYSQNLPNFFEPGSEESFESKSSFYEMAQNEKSRYGHLFSAIEKKPYDVLTYELYMDWYDVLTASGTSAKDRAWRGSNKIDVRIDSANVRTLVFDAVNMKIQSVMAEGKNVTPVPQPVNGKLTVTLPYTYQKGDTVTVTINYLYVAVDMDRGFFLYPEKMYMGKIPGTEDSVFVEARLAYTMSEPQDARFWMPCNDQPDDKALATISVRVPKDFVAVSNGLIYKIDDMDTYVTYTWKENSPMATYLMAVTASKYVTYSDWYKKLSNPKDSVEIQYYIWKKDFDATKTDGKEYNAHNAFSNTVNMMNCFSSRFVEYPFSKYGMVAIHPFSFGGMEHQTMTSINRTWMRTNEHFGIAHELAHQWIGDLITCATWKDIWINEGGATWSSNVWAEHLWGNDAYFMNMLGERAGYLRSGGLALPPIYDLPVNTIFGKYVTLVYEKSSWVYHQLRVMMGDSVFYPALRSMLTKFGGKSLETEDFINHFVSEVKTSPIDLNIFFDQWLMKSGHPVFDANLVYTKKGADYNANITLTQTQSGTNVPDAFQLPVRMLFWGPQGMKVMDTLLVKNQVENYNVTLPFLPDSALIDTTFSLHVVNKMLTSVSDKPDNDNVLSVLPNPASNKILVSFKQKTPGYVTLNLIDVTGQKVKSIEMDGLSASGLSTLTINLDGVPSGIYFVEFNSPDIKATHKVVVIKE